MNPCILVTGGAGFIGSHCCVELLENNFDVVVLDNLSNSSPKVFDQIEKITAKRPTFIHGDIRDENALAQIFLNHKIAAVIHFAGLKAVAESMEMPLHYFDHNINGTLSLLRAMEKYQVGHLVFSSSATVYGDAHPSPLHENLSTATPTNNYGYSKLVVEQILKATAASNPRLWSFAILRYFNPIGAHCSGLIGEHPHGTPNNLLPYLTQTALGQRQMLNIYGADYPTKDGTGIRDFIHVVDLARAHVKALQYLFAQRPSIEIWNVGTGLGYSVLDVVQRFEQVNQRPLNYQFVERRPGDVAVCFADASKAKRQLGFVAEYDLDTMLRDAWHWQCQNPNGFD
jgi:UDP-glucose 4-epimerase